MGTDIHSVAQVRKNGRWETVEKRINGDWRDYDYFAMLAGVRNGRGFAGVDTGDGFTPICNPRGLPSDFGVDHESHHEGLWMGDHSYSWLTLQDLVRYDLSQTTKQRGICEIDIYTVWKESKKLWPSRSSSGVSGPGVMIISECEVPEYLQKIAEGEIDPKISEFGGVRDWLYVRFEVAYQYGDNANIKKLLSRMFEIAVANGLLNRPDHVRFVFGFDS